MSLEQTIRNMISEELDKRLNQGPDYRSVADACQKLDLSRTSLWRGIKKGEVKSITIGNRRLIDINQFQK